MRVAAIVFGVAFALVTASLLLANHIVLKTDPAAEAVAAKIFEGVRSGNDAVLRPHLTPELSAKASPDQIRTLQVYAPRQAPKEKRLINFTQTYGAKEVLTARYELTYPNEGVLYDVRLVRPKGGAGPWRAESFFLRRATNAQLAVNQLSLAKPPGQLVFLVFTVGTPLLMLAALTTVLNAPRFKLKWLWAIGTLFGLCTFAMNWTTGQMQFQPIMLNLIGGGLMRAGYLGFFPWTLKFTLPIGAVAGFWRAAKARREAKEALDASIAGF